MVRAGGNGFVERVARQLKLAFLKIEVAQFFVISRRWIVTNRKLKLSDALAARKSLEGVASESDIGKRFGEEIDECAERTEKQNDEDPIVIRPPPNEMDDRQSLEEEAPRIE